MIKTGFGHDRGGMGWMLRVIFTSGYYLDLGGYDMTRQECIDALKLNTGFNVDNNPRKDWKITQLYPLPKRKQKPQEDGILVQWHFDEAERISVTGLQDWH